MKLFFILLLLVGFQSEVPYKPSDEFQVNINLVFKTRDTKYGKYTYDQNGERLDNVSPSPLPFLTVTVNQFKIQYTVLDRERLLKKESSQLNDSDEIQGVGLTLVLTTIIKPYVTETYYDFVAIQK